MKKLNLLLLISFLSCSASLLAQDDLDNYVNRLRTSKKNGGSETAFMSAGSDFLYGFEYYEAKNFSSAFNYFTDVIRKDKENAYANYLAGVCLMKQNDKYKATQAQDYLNNAFRLNPNLKNRYPTDVPNAADVSPKPSNAPVTLDAYIESLKYSKATNGAETKMFTVGHELIGGIEWMEKDEYSSAETMFSLALGHDANHVYANYLKGYSLVAQGKLNDALPFLNKAYAVDPTLKARLLKDASGAIKRWNSLVESRKPKLSPTKEIRYGGALVYGNYTCSQTVWNGPNTSPAFRSDYKGYIALKADGTYRWLDDGATGKYKYDSKTGEITWLSGYFKDSGVKLTQYQTSSAKSGQFTVNYTDSYRWECGCTNK